jgi:hypothetical protein
MGRRGEESAGFDQFNRISYFLAITQMRRVMRHEGGTRADLCTVPRNLETSADGAGDSQLNIAGIFSSFYKWVLCFRPRRGANGQWRNGFVAQPRVSRVGSFPLRVGPMSLDIGFLCGGLSLRYCKHYTNPPPANNNLTDSGATADARGSPGFPAAGLRPEQWRVREREQVRCR